MKKDYLVVFVFTRTSGRSAPLVLVPVPLNVSTIHHLSLALTMTCLDFDIPAFDTSLQGEIQYSVGRQAVLNKSKKTLGILSNHMH